MCLRIITATSSLTAASIVLAVVLPTGRSTGPMSAADPRLPSNGVTGALVIVGGGDLPDTVRKRFLDLAGGKHARLVIIPTASERADNPQLVSGSINWMSGEAASVEFLHTRNRQQANDPGFVRPLTQATGAWLSGGDQMRLLEPYHGTLVEKELHNLLRRGGVIGGTSAGASAMSDVAILGGNPQARVGEGFGLLPGVVIDQHFQNRNRLGRLLGVLARYPQAVGLGIDEQTAAIVRGRTLTVVGNANVRLCLPAADLHPPRVRVLKEGDRVALAVSP